MSFTRKQALALLEWGKRNKEAIEAYSNPQHPAHAEAQLYADRLMAIAATPGARDDPREPPFDADTFMTGFYAGNAAARQRLQGVVAGDTAPAPLAVPMPEDDALAALRGLSPEAAQARIAELSGNQEWGKLLTAERDPIALAGWELLNRVAAGESAALPAIATAPAPAQPAIMGGGALPRGSDPGPTALARYEQLEAAIVADPNHAYRNSSHPNHQAAVAERDAAFTAALGESSGGGEG